MSVARKPAAGGEGPKERASGRRTSNTPTRERKPSVRRSPEATKQLILEACQRLLAKNGPDAVGLKDVAAEAGVSHALVTHYFGSIDALLLAALEDYAELQRKSILERILLQKDAGPREWMQQFFAWGSRPETARVLAFTFLKGMITREDFFSKKQRGAARVVDAVLERAASLGKDAPRFERRDLEFIVLLVLAATHGYALGREGYWPSLGVDAPGEREDKFFFDRLADLVELFTLSHASSAPAYPPDQSRAQKSSPKR